MFGGSCRRNKLEDELGWQAGCGGQAGAGLRMRADGAILPARRRVPGRAGGRQACGQLADIWPSNLRCIGTSPASVPNRVGERQMEDLLLPVQALYKAHSCEAPPGYDAAAGTAARVQCQPWLALKSGHIFGGNAAPSSALT